MSEGSTLPVEPTEGRFILLSLVVSAFAAWTPWVLAGLLLIDIGRSFDLSVGFAGQIRTTSSVVGVLTAFVVGALSVRFSHKRILMASLSAIAVSALACFLAPNFAMVLASYSLLGLPMAAVLPMSTSLAAEHIHLEGRAGAVGWIVAGTALAGIIGAPVINLVAGVGGWRLAFLGFVLPVSILSVLLTSRCIPNRPSRHLKSKGKAGYMEGFNEVFTNISSIACASGYALSLTAFQAIGFYSPSFFRERFQVPPGFASLQVSGLYLCLTAGSLLSGRLVNRFGRKPVTVSAALVAGLLILSFTNVANLWASLVLALLGYMFAGAAISASHSLALEQVPRFRGTMMSINSAAEKVGAALGSGIGGLVILLYGWRLMGLTLGAAGIAASAVYHLLATDPTKA